MSRLKLRPVLGVVLCCLTACFSLKGADAGVAPEEIFPDSTILAIAIPDLGAARAAAAGSRIGEILKQPEVRAFLDPIAARILEQYGETRVIEPRVPAAETLDSALFAGGLSFCLYSRGPGAEPGIIFSFTPKDPKAFENLVTPFLNGQPLPIGRPIPLGGGETAPGALYDNGRLLVCKPFTDMGASLNRIKDAAKHADGTLAASANFKNAQSAIGHTQAWMFVNPASLLDSAPKAPNPNMPPLKMIYSAAGLDSMGGLMLGFDISGGELNTSVFLGLNGAPKGLMNLAGTTAVKKDALQIAAEDATYVSAGTFHLARVLPIAKEIAGAVAPPLAQKIDELLAQAAEKIGFDLQKDLFSNIDSDFAMSQTRSSTAMPLTLSAGLNGAVHIKNPAKVAECLKKLKAFAEQMLAVNGTPTFMTRVSSVEYQGSTIYYYNQTLNGSICLAVVKDRLVWANSLNAAKAGIRQLSASSNILSNKDFQMAVSRVSGKAFDAENLPTSLSYSADTGGGTGLLMLSLLGYSAEAGVVAGISEAVHHGALLPPNPNELEMLHELTSHPAGRTALNIANSVDLNFWPDENFFVAHRLSRGSVNTFSDKGWLVRSEMPPPMPNSAAEPMIVVAVIAIVAAIAIPNLLRSRMAANETAAVAACKAFATAEDIYRRTDYNKDGVLEYAQSLKGKDSLYETAPGAGDIAMIDRSFANAEAGPGATPKAGYFFKILKAQGAHVNGGARSYLLKGRMTFGYALLAYPAQYDGTGRNVFIISHEGVIYEKDLGVGTQGIVDLMTEFDPDNTWVIAE